MRLQGWDSSLINSTIKRLVDIRCQATGSNMFSIKVGVIFTFPALKSVGDQKALYDNKDLPGTIEIFIPSFMELHSFTI